MAAQRRTREELSEIALALRACRDAFVPTVVFSLFINLLMFVLPLYMLQVYDRVITTGSVETLIVLTGLAAVGLFGFGFFEFLRSRLLVRAGVKLNRLLGGRVFSATFRASVGRQGDQAGGQALRDLDALREFLSGGGLIAFCDAPWVPIFLAVIFIFHPLLGALAFVGAIIIFCLALANEMTTRKPLGIASGTMVRANNFVGTSLRNAEALQAMGMMRGVLRRWSENHGQAMAYQAVASDRAGAILASSKFVRMFLQMGVLAVGAYLAIQQEITPGIMIAASIVMGRALAPVEMAVGQWRNFSNARNSYGRLRGLLNSVPVEEERISLPPPQGHVTVQNLIASPPGMRTAVLKGLSFELSPGEAVGLIGPSAAGKSTLARVLVGVWPVAAGAVRLDGAELSQWNREELGPHIGYLPQDIELFEGTVAENIARFPDSLDSEKIVAAAQRAGVHEMICRLPEGYNTEVGSGGQALSGGQRQRVGLARALYGEPAIIILDEPNSNLDQEGEAALAETLSRLRDENKTLLVISHRFNLLKAVDRIIVLKAGMIEADGPRDRVLQKFAKPRAVPEQKAAQAADTDAAE